MFFSGRDWETRQEEGKRNRVKYREILDEKLLQSAQELRLKWLRDKSLNVLE